MISGKRCFVARRGVPKVLQDLLQNYASNEFLKNVGIRSSFCLFARQFCHIFSFHHTFHTTAIKERGLISHDDKHQPPRLLVVQPRVYPKQYLDVKLQEALRLADSLEELRGDANASARDARRLPPHVVVQNPENGTSKKHRKRVRADAYFGGGTVESIRAHVLANDSQQERLDAVFVNASLTAVQQRNLERSWGKPVLDRVGLIIEIFSAHAESKEARLQVELAALNYKRSRLVRISSKEGRRTFGMDSEAEVVSARGRGTGGQGFISGAGETEIQLQRRRQKVILSDTVGFISDLPIQLVEAFHSTLEEVVEADFLLHVIDSSAPNADEQRATVLKVLEDIGVSKEKFKSHTIEVWNKVDLLEITNTTNSMDSLKIEEAKRKTPLLALGSTLLEDKSSLNGENMQEEHEVEMPAFVLENETPPNTEASMKESVVNEGISWSHEGIPCVSTSAVEGTGLQELLNLLDENFINATNYSEIGT
eukprot:c24029_g1_i1 orf=438-1883(-)